MPKPRPLAAVFGAEEEELPTLPAEELSLEDLEDEDEEDELTDILDEAGPAEVTEEKG